MKIGILTFHKVNNLGAILQAFALNKYIEMHINNCNCEVIDFTPNNANVSNDGLLIKMLKLIKHLIFWRQYKNDRKRNERFEAFRNNRMTISPVTYHGDEEIKKCSGVYDVLISGSDQILNITLTGESTSFYLDFDDKAKKVSYASSFGRMDITDKEKELIRKELIKFRFLSFREKSGAQIVQNLIGVEGKEVLDPVFLMERKCWLGLCNNELILPKGFAFVYAMEMTDGIKNAVLEVKNRFNLPIIIVNGSGQHNAIKGDEDTTCGPMEFLRYIRDAEIVITNSFHGTAFSLIFEKKFLCIAHSKRNVRIENLLKNIYSQDKQIDVDCKNVLLNECIIDSRLVIFRLNEMISNSKKYLMYALKP